MRLLLSALFIFTLNALASEFEAPTAYIDPAMQAAILKGEKAPFGAESESIIIDGKERFTGFKPQRSQYEGAVFRDFPIWKGKAAGQEIPRSLDYTKIAPPNIVNQACGDCWAQGAAMAFQGVIGWLDKMSRDISRQAIIDCSGYGSCGGGQISVGFFEDPKGAVYTTDYGYAGYTQRCQSSHLNYKEKARHTGFIRAAAGTKPKIADYQRANMEMGPFEGCGASSALSGADKDGFILKNKGGGVDHCWAWYGWVRGEDYGKPAGIYGIAVNSWGKNWGKNGIVYVRWGQDDVSLDGNVLVEGAYIDYKDPAPQEPVVIDVKIGAISYHIVIEPSYVSHKDELLAQIKKAMDKVEAQ